MGFDFKKKYSEPSDLDQLRYGKLMIMTDQASFWKLQTW